MGADPLSLGAMALSTVAAGGELFGGFAEADVLKSQAKAAERDAKIAQIRIIQQEADAFEELNDVTAQINLFRAGRGLALDSATGRAIRADRRKRAMEGKNVTRLNGLRQRDALTQEASTLRTRARVAPLLGATRAAGDLFDAGTGFADLFDRGGG